jgi:nucleoside-diphosphate-sugar epimerase
VSKLTKLGWKAKINLRDGISRTYDWYKQNMVDDEINGR